MERYKLNKNDIKIHNIVYAVTSEIDHEMARWFLLENMPNTNYDEYVIVEGCHCSCYDFDDTAWEAIKYTENELLEICKDRLKENTWYKEEKDFYKLVYDYFK